MRPLVVASQGRDAPGRLLTYIWAGAPEVGRWFENPYTGKAGYMQVIQGQMMPVIILISGASTRLILPKILKTGLAISRQIRPM